MRTGRAKRVRTGLGALCGAAALCLTGAVGAAAAAAPLCAQEPASAAGPRAAAFDAMAARDARLQARVSLQAGFVTVGELLEALSRSSGALLEDDARSGAGDDVVAVFLHDTRVIDAMEALQSLLSYREALWQWVVEEDGGAEAPRLRYRLVRSGAAQRYAAGVRRAIAADFAAEHDALREGLALDPEALENAARTSPVLADLAANPRKRAGLEAFFAMSDAARKTALRPGGDGVRVPVGQLSPEAQAFVRATFAAAEPTDAKGQPLPPPDAVTFQTSALGSRITPVLHIEVAGAGPLHPAPPAVK